MNLKLFLNKLFLLFLIVFIGIASCFVLTNKVNKYLFLCFVIVYIFSIILFINKFNIEKTMIILFFLCIPFMIDVNLINIDDFHMVTKEYYTFNFLQIFCIYFLIKILKNRHEIKKGMDIFLIILFNIVCIVGVFMSINPTAGFYDYIRYFELTVIYIFFSRIFNYKRYENIIYNCLVLALLFQLILGCVQKIIGGPVGLSILGEGFEVFRAGVSGYELGISGTFGHPGPIALYATFLLSILLFNKLIKKSVRITGITASSLIIILAAGRTSILIMILVYVLFFINDFIQLNTRSILISTQIIILTIISFILFSKNLEPIISRFLASDVEQQFENRMEHVIIGMNYIKQHAILGLGLNNYLDNTYRDYASSFYNNFFLNNPIHNVYIQYTVETGIVGAILLLAFMIYFFVLYFRIKKTLDKNIKNMLKGCLTVIIIWLIYGFQGWSGIQTRMLLILLLSCSVISNRYYSN